MQIARKQHGAVYTPAPLARRILREARITNHEIPVLCDPACGDGAILAEAAKVLCTLPKAYGGEPALCAGAESGIPAAADDPEKLEARGRRHRSLHHFL